MLTSLVTLAALGVVLFLGTLLFRRVRTPGRPHVPLSGGVLVMRVPKRNGILLGVCALFPAALLAAIATGALDSRSGGWLGAVASVLAAAAAAAVALHQFVSAFRSRFVVDEFGLSRIGVLTRRRIRWSEVARLAFNPVNRWFFITTADGTHLWIPIDANGIGDFAAVALARLPRSTLSADAFARDALRDLATPERSTGA
ncbi:MAG TPA: PH domain-containing protein [Anaeromyxobacter sp.]